MSDTSRLGAALAAAALTVTAAWLVPAGASTAGASVTPGTPGGHFNVGATHSPRLERMLAGSARTRAAGAPLAPTKNAVLGIDVASGQHDGGATIDWPQVAAAGYKFAFVKTTEGSYYANPFYAADAAGAKAAGLLVAAYHFANPRFSNGTLQADFALDHAGPAGSGVDGVTLPLILDLEFDPYTASDHTNECYGLTPKQMVAWIRAFTTEAVRRTGQHPVIYTIFDWWDKCTANSAAFSADPLWVAYYAPGATAPLLPAGWPAFTYWQYTSAGKVPGIQGDTDLSEVNPAALKVAAPGNQSAQAGSSVRVPVRALSGAPKVPLSYAAEGLPAGLAIDPATGVISGTLPAQAGSSPVSVTVSGTGLVPVTERFTWNVHRTVRLTTPRDRSAKAGSPQLLRVGAADGLPGCTLTFAAAGLPPGLAISPCGSVSGWLAKAGSYHPVVTVTDSGGAVLGTASFGWLVGPPPGAGPAGHMRPASESGCLAQAGTGIKVVACGHIPNQRWTITPGGALRLRHECLAVSGTEGQLKLKACRDSVFQQWRPGQAGALVSQWQGQCLAATSHGRVAAAACSGGAAQAWTLPAGPLTSGVPGWCASAWHAAGTTAGPVTLRGCRSGRATAWTAAPDGTLRGDGKCLSISYPPAAGAPVRMAACRATPAQQWQPATGAVAAQLVNPLTGLCLADPADAASAVRLALGYCLTADPGTTWLPS